MALFGRGHLPRKTTRVSPTSPRQAGRDSSRPRRSSATPHHDPYLDEPDHREITQGGGVNGFKVGDGDIELTSADRVDSEIVSLLEAASPQQLYESALAHYIEAKHDQIEHIEDRLDHLIDVEQARLQQIVGNRPGLLSTPASRRQWQALQGRQQARLSVLTQRLASVREIRDGTHLHSPRIEELATRKLRAAHPELASRWDAMQIELRRESLLTKFGDDESRAQGKHRGGGLKLKPSR